MLPPPQRSAGRHAVPFQYTFQRVVANSTIPSLALYTKQVPSTAVLLKFLSASVMGRLESGSSATPAGLLELITAIAAQVMSVARTLVGQEEAALDVGAGSPQEAKARELGLDPLFSPQQRPHTAAAFAAAPRFILLDFRSAA